MEQSSWEWLEAQASLATERGLCDIIYLFVEQMDATGVPTNVIAEKGGLPVDFVSRMLVAEDQVTLATLVRIANALGKRLVLRIEEITPPPGT